MITKILHLFITLFVLQTASTTSAQVITVDMGTFSAPACGRPQHDLSKSPSIAPQDSQRQIRVTAKIFVEPTNSTTMSAVETCAQRARSELSESRSTANLQLFSETFQEYLAACARRSEAGIRTVKSVLTSNSSCSL